jgi:hypothetical protein
MVQKQLVNGTNVKYFLISKAEIDAIVSTQLLEERYANVKTAEGNQRFRHVARQRQRR